jgi:predicted AAA+ superfamily ATPase
LEEKMEEKVVERQFIERKIFGNLKKQARERKISLLLGARQVGKTTLLKGLFRELVGTKKGSGLFLDLDVLSNYEKVSSFDNLVNTLKLNGYDEKSKTRFFLFLDEFQRYPDMQMILKN